MRFRFNELNVFRRTDKTPNQVISRPKTICFFLFLVLLTFSYKLSSSFFSASANYKRIDIRRHSYASLKNCFNYKNCHLNEKFKIFFLGQTYDKWNDYEDIIERAHEVDQACIVLFFVRDQRDLFFLENFLRQSEEANMNLLIIDVARKSLGFSYDQIHRYTQFSNGSISNNNEHIKFREYIKCALIASYNAPRDDTTRNNNLNIHFSLTDLPRFDMDALNLSENFLFLSSKRHHLLTYHHNILGKLSLKTIEIVGLIEKVFKSYSINFIIDLKCKLDTSSKIRDLCFNEYTRAKFLINSTFSLILNENSDGLGFWSLDNTIRLVECLRVGTIPVLINQDIHLPLSELIAWDEVIIYLPKTHISRIDTFLQNINEAEIIKRRTKAYDLYRVYFTDSKTQFRTLITVLRQRLNLTPLQFSPLNSSLNMAIKSKFKYKFDSVDKTGVIENKTKNLLRNFFVSKFAMDSYSKWNQYYYPFKMFPSQPNQLFLPNNVRYSINSDNYKLIYENEDQTDIDFESGIHGGTYARRLFSRNLGGNFDDEEFTIVFYSYEREKKLASILTKYLHLRFLNRIILIWNRNSTRPSNLFLNKFRRELDKKKNLVLISNVNRNLNKRFLPYDMIQTDAVLNVNDDAQLTNEAIALGFRVWRENRDQLVGFAPRGHSWHVKSQQYIFRTYFNCEYSMVLTTAVFYHRFYNYQYTYILDKRIKDKVYDFDNCDDIAFNYMVSSMIRKPPIKVSSISFQACQNCGNIDRARFLASKKKNVFSQRHECLSYFNRIFGYNPLLYSQYRVNSASFQTKHHGKCFKTL